MAFQLKPDKILVVGPQSRELVKTFAPELDVQYTPAFRYQWIFENAKAPKAGNELLVLLGYGLSSAVSTLRLLMNIQNDLKQFDRVLIKLHPAGYFDADRLLKEAQLRLPDHFEFIDGKLEKFLNRVGVGLCTATGTSVELILRGIPVVVMAEKYALTMNYMSGQEDPEIWRLCFSERQVKEALTAFKELSEKSFDKLSQKALEFQRLYFANPHEDYWKNYLFLP